MTDRELLELAAKAAGIEHGTDRIDSGVSITDSGGRCRTLPQWNPLTDDGDAFRLMVRLGIDLVHFRGHVRADVCGMPDTHELHGDDPCAATRRAIVRAAAAIGRAKE